MTAMRIFVSYSHTDSSFCRALVLSLRAAGADVWYDEHNLDSGQLMDVVQREIDSRSVFIVILTKAAFASSWVKRETTWAYEMTDRDPTRIILPVTAATIERTDFNGSQGWLFLSDFKRIEAPNYQPFTEKEAVQRTVRALALTLPGEVPAPVAPQANETTDDLIARGKALNAQSQHQATLALFQQATLLTPQSSEAWFQLGNAFYNLQRYQEALTAYDQVLTLEPNDSITWTNKGIVLKKLHRDQEALAAFDHTLALDPKAAHTWKFKGMLLMNLQHYHEALAAYEQVLTLQPSDAFIWYDKGCILAILQ